jgi:hypothetical protein
VKKRFGIALFALGAVGVLPLCLLVVWAAYLGGAFVSKNDLNPGDVSTDFAIWRFLVANESSLSRRPRCFVPWQRQTRQESSPVTQSRNRTAHCLLWRDRVGPVIFNTFGSMKTQANLAQHVRRQNDG